MREEITIEETVGRPSPSLVRRVSWGAIFAGLFVTIVVQLTLTLLGASIGAATINPAQEQNPANGLGIGSAIWLLGSALIAIWCGACVAGRLSGGPRRADGLVHGIVTWCVATVVALFLLATATGALLGGTGALLKGFMASSQPAQGRGQDALSAATEQLRNMFPQTQAVLPPTGRTEGQGGQLTQMAQQDPQLAAALGRMQTAGGADASPAARQEVISILTTRHGLDQQQASTMVSQWSQQLSQIGAQAEQKAREVGQTAAQGVAQGALWAFIALVLQMLVAAWGGWAGAASLRDYPVRRTPAPA